MMKFTFVGNLVNDPEMKDTKSGSKVCRFRVASNHIGKDKNMEADFFQVVVWNKLGETCAKYLSKGRKVAIDGKIHNNTYTAQDGQKRTVDEYWADDVEFLNGNDNGGNRANSSQNTSIDNYEPVDDVDLPF